MLKGSQAKSNTLGGFNEMSSGFLGVLGAEEGSRGMGEWLERDSETILPPDDFPSFFSFVGLFDLVDPSEGLLSSHLRVKASFSPAPASEDDGNR